MAPRQGFLPVEVEWEGKKYTIPARSIMPLLVQMESHVTLTEIQEAAARGSVPQAKVAAAYTVVLQHLGIEIEADEVYLAMFPGEGAVTNQAVAVVRSVMHMMIPPEAMAARMKAVQSGNGSAPAVHSVGSSKRRSKRG